MPIIPAEQPLELRLAGRGEPDLLDVALEFTVLEILNHERKRIRYAKRRLNKVAEVGADLQRSVNVGRRGGQLGKTEIAVDCKIGEESAVLAEVITPCHPGTGRQRNSIADPSAAEG